jgi:hypothetical protein
MPALHCFELLQQKPLDFRALHECLTNSHKEQEVCTRLNLLEADTKKSRMRNFLRCYAIKVSVCGQSRIDFFTMQRKMVTVQLWMMQQMMKKMRTHMIETVWMLPLCHLLCRHLPPINTASACMEAKQLAGSLTMFDVNTKYKNLPAIQLGNFNTIAIQCRFRLRCRT